MCWRRQWHPTPVLLPGKSHGRRSLVGCSPWVAKSWTRLSDFTFTFYFYALEKDMATHSSVLAWRIPGTGEPGGLPSMGSHRVGHNWSDLAAAAAVSWKGGRAWSQDAWRFQNLQNLVPPFVSAGLHQPKNTDWGWLYLEHSRLDLLTNSFVCGEWGKQCEMPFSWNL